MPLEYNPLDSSKIHYISRDKDPTNTGVQQSTTDSSHSTAGACSTTQVFRATLPDIDEESDTDENSENSRNSIENANPDLSHQRTNSQISLSSQNTYENNMAEKTVPQFLKAAGPLLNYKFDGEPSKLKGFINDVKLISQLAENDDTKSFCVKYVIARLEGKAEECVPDDCDDIDDLIDALKSKVKPDCTKVVEGRMMALRLEKNNFSKFAEKVEELADSFRRSLVSEGIPKTLADEMVITKCVELCRKTSKSDVVKSVLSATKYTTPKEVIATFIVESDTARREFKEKQASKQNKFNKPNQNRRGGFKSNFRGNKNHFDNRNRNNDNGQRRDQHQNRNGNNRGHGNSNRGGFRGNSNRERTIRVVAGTQPIQSTSAEQNAQPAEQFFRLV